MKNILIIDDDIHIGDVLEEILTKEDTAFPALIREQKHSMYFLAQNQTLYCLI